MIVNFQYKISEDYLRRLSERAHCLVENLNSYVGCILPQDKKITAASVSQFAQENNIKMEWWDFSGDVKADDHVSGINYCVRDNGTSYYRILIDKRIRDLDDGSEAGKVAMQAELKESLLHELCHVLLKHQGAFTFSNNPSADILTRVLWKNQIYLKNEGIQNLDAELLAAVLGFWPISLFNEKYRNSRFDFRVIAGEWRMTIESVAQWALISFYEFDRIHYLKRIEKFVDESCSGIESSFGLTEKVFVQPGTAAAKTAAEKGDTMVVGEKYICRAFYEHHNRHVGVESDFILVFGRLINKIYEK